MGTWGWILLACLVAYATKLIGFLVPERLLQGPRVARVTGVLTVALLAALVVMNTFASGTALVLDARIAALVVACLALLARLPFLAVVVLGAVAAALARAAGMG